MELWNVELWNLWSLERGAVEREDLECRALEYGNFVLCNVGLWSVSVKLWMCYSVECGVLEYGAV